MNSADEKNEIKKREEFFLIATHELRTPLTAIRASAELILNSYKDQIPNKDVKELLVNIDTASIRLIKIVNDFLEAPSLEQGKIKVKNEVFSVSGLICKVIEDLKILALKKNITIKCNEPKSSLPNVLADKAGVEQVLINLIGNAIKFTSQGGVIISSELENDFIRIRVLDTGIGISKNNQKLLFKKFQEINNSIKDSMYGTGLGLYISKMLVSKMGGEIMLERSAEEKGSVFSFTIPVAK